MSKDEYDLLQQADYAYLLHRVNQLQNAKITSVIWYCQRRGLIDQTTEQGRNNYQHRLDSSRLEARKRRLALARVEERKRRKESE